MTTYLYALFSVALVSLVSLVGIFFISLKEDFLKKYISIFISLAVGALLGDAFIHIIPEAFEELSSSTYAGVLIIIGVLLFFVMEKFLHWHHHGEDKDDESVHPVGKLILFSDGIHNLIDGIIIGVSFLVGVPVGVATTIAVILHEIPQEIGDFAVLIHSGFSKKRALWLNFLSALLAVVGVVIVIIIGEIAESSISFFLPVAAGGFIYVAVADLIPELHKHKDIKISIYQIMAGALGVFLMVLLTFLE